MGTNYYLTEMGTNYYLTENCCPNCKRHDRLHIGKSSGGWHFSLHVIPDKGINTLYDWMVRFAKEGSVIQDEYGKVVDRLEMIDIITIRSWLKDDPDRRSSAWYHYNYAEKGLNGLARCKTGRSCDGHGDGPWDYIDGEFC